MIKILYTVIIYPLVQLIEFCYMFFYRFTNKLFPSDLKVGVSIIGVSFAVTIFCLPLYIIAERWQQIQRDTEKRLQPGVDRIKSVFKGDEQYMMLSTYYKQNHYHPMMALRSSFGLLIQIPFFIAAYNYLSKSPDIAGRTFLFIQDLGKPDALFSIGKFSINVLPILMTAINIIAGAIYTKGFKFKEKAQIYAMAAIFLVLLYNSPSGLVLYWTMNNVFSLIKNIFYKIKNPKRVLYIIMCSVIGIADFVLLFIDKRSFNDRIAAVAVSLILVAIPLLVKAVKFALNTFLLPLVQNDKLRTNIFLFCAISVCLLSGVILPSLLINSSIQEFTDLGTAKSPIVFIVTAFLQSFGLFVFWPVCIYFLFGKRIKTIITSFFLMLLVGGLVDAFVFPGKYGIMDNTLRFTSIVNSNFDKLPYILLNLFVLLVIFVALFTLVKFFPKAVFAGAQVLLIGFTIFSVANFIRTDVSYKNYKKMPVANVAMSSISPQIHLTKTGKNVVIFMLDRASPSYIDSIFGELPQLKTQYQGWTFYKNTISFGGHTLTGAPAIFGGYEYTPLEINKRQKDTMLKKHNESLLMLPRIFTEQADFDAMIADSSWANYSWNADMRIAEPFPLINAINLEDRYVSVWKKLNPNKFLENPKKTFEWTERNFLWVSLFRIAPTFIRSFIYYDGTWWSDWNLTSMSYLPPEYSELEFLPILTDFECKKIGSFVSITNDMTHDDDKLQPPLYEPAQKITAVGTGKYSESKGYPGNAAALRLIGLWLDFLRKNDVYDNTRIIIVSDHGIGEQDAANEDFDGSTLQDNYYKDANHPLLMVKDFGAQNDFETSMDFMTIADVPSISLKGIVDQPTNPFTSSPVNQEIKEKYGAITTISNIWDPTRHLTRTTFPIKDNEWYTVRDNIFESKNWKQGLPEN